MANYLPDIRFSDRRTLEGRRPNNSQIDAHWDNLDFFESYDDYVPNGLSPVQILRDSFEKYIIQTPIESNTIGIQVIYIERRRETPKTMFLIKRKYDNLTQEYRINEYNPNSYLNYNDFTHDNVFQNYQLEELIEQVQGFHKIIQITLCEIYNDDNDSRDIADNYPFTIPIQLLYRKIPVSMQNANNLLRQQRTQATRLANLRIADANAENAASEQQRRMERLQTGAEISPEAQERMDRQFAEMNRYNVDPPTTQNPTQLQDVNDTELLNKPIPSFAWPGQCQICLGDGIEDLCRVNCGVGHIFHCDCINGWRNTRTDYGWNNKCPVCTQEQITKMVKFEDYGRLPLSFGKKRGNSDKQLKMINSEIKYLKMI